MVAGDEPLSGVDCRTTLVEEIDDQLRNGDGHDARTRLGIIEDMLVGRAEFGTPAADEPFLSGEFDRKYNSNRRAE